MKIIIALHTSAGELAREEIEIESDTVTLEDLVDLSIDACGWTLAAGDTIRIVEAE